MKKCPILIGKVENPECLQHECAWWDSWKGACKVVIKE